MGYQTFWKIAMTPLKEWIIRHGRSFKKFTEIIYVKPLQRILEKHLKRKRRKCYRSNMPAAKMDKGALQVLKKHFKEEE